MQPPKTPTRLQRRYSDRDGPVASPPTHSTTAKAIRKEFTMIHAFIPAHEKAIAHVFISNNQAHQVSTVPIVAWQMVPQGGGRFVARPVLAIDVGDNARIGIPSCWGVITEDVIYEDQGAFERGSVSMLQRQNGEV